MNLLMFSGESTRNKDWIYQVKDAVGHLFGEVYLQDYDHWQHEDGKIDFDLELAKLSKKMSEFKGPYMVFAKSIGTVLVVKALNTGVIKPEALFLCGVPLAFIKDNYLEYGECLAAARIPVTVVQNEADPLGSFAEVEEYLGSYIDDGHDFKFISMQGDTHNYLDFDFLNCELVLRLSEC